ncbi:hypothetical protein M2161_000958 [Streptomyces sp. SAI-133]|nr:hypothetical protein [Streptomyces sp. SAI-133]
MRAKYRPPAGSSASVTGPHPAEGSPPCLLGPDTWQRRTFSGQERPSQAEVRDLVADAVCIEADSGTAA